MILSNPEGNSAIQVAKDINIFFSNDETSLNDHVKEVCKDQNCEITDYDDKVMAVLLGDTDQHDNPNQLEGNL